MDCGIRPAFVGSAVGDGRGPAGGPLARFPEPQEPAVKGDKNSARELPVRSPESQEEAVLWHRT